MANEPQAVDLLRQIEQYLLQIGALQTSEQRHAERRAKKEESKRNGLKAIIAHGLTDLRFRASTVEESFAGIDSWLRGIDDKLTALTECVNTLKARIDQQDASLGKVLARVVQDLTQLKRQQAPSQQDVIGWPLPAPATGDPLPPNPTTVC